ncbi:MAG: hypothetical protein RAO94_10145 [Candidatus Stygibacter australis]|nr:hypothetical protein [Candidatus Stygibacter australis]MDP8322698.1 hypothetical protein [Candidatus Stygibacter australis]
MLRKLIITILLIGTFGLYAKVNEKNILFTIRFGQGGFSDSRSDIDKLGGGQLAFDLKLARFPLALSLSGESYTNGPDPTHSYEIADMKVLNLIYMKKVSHRINLFSGGGICWLEVPDNAGGYDNGIGIDAELGINVIVFWKLGLYGMYKYLYANDNGLIDFNEHIGMLGITFNFGL